jgi:hypothetical protein
MWGLVAAHAAARDQRVSVADVCAVAAASAQVSGCWASTGSALGPDFVLCVTDPVSEQLAELHLTLGQGPCLDAVAAAAPVLAGDLSDAEPGGRWPAFIPAARQLGAAAIFAFPLTIGAIRAGVAGLYRDTPGPMTSAQLGDCLILADAATVLLLDSQRDGADAAAGGAGGELVGRAAGLALHRTEIDRATGMLTEQLGVGVESAFARLRAYAYAHDRRLADVAGDIVARRLRLRRDPPLDGDQ